MQALSQSPFLQALGYAITNSLWQCALLWLLVFLFSNAIKLSSHSKYSVALIGQLAGFLWFIFTFRFYYIECSNALNDLSVYNYGNASPLVIEPEVNNFSSALLFVVSKAEQFFPWLSVAYIFLLCLLTVRWIKCYRLTQSIKHEGLSKTNIEWKLFVKRIAGELGIKQDVKIYLSELVKGPVTIGFLKPVILIPLASINHLTTEQMEAVILHELAHIKRADYLINILQSIIETTLFFNPFTQLISRMIKKERENSCDDWVLQFKYNASMYAEALLRIAVLQNASKLAMHASGTKGDLFSRVKRMLNQNEKTFAYRNRLFALVLITGILSSVAWFHPTAAVSQQHVVSANAKHVVVEPLVAKVSNPLFNPIFFLSKPLTDEVNKTIENAKVDVESSLSIPQQIKNVVIENITPAALEKLKEINVDWESPTVKALSEADESLQNLKISPEIKDDDFGGISTNKLMKAGDLPKMNDDVALQFSALENNLNLYNIDVDKLKETIQESLDQIQNISANFQKKITLQIDQLDAKKDKLESEKQLLLNEKEKHQKTLLLKKQVDEDTSIPQVNNTTTFFTPDIQTNYTASYSNYSYKDAAPYITSVNYEQPVEELPSDSTNTKSPLIVILKGDPQNDQSSKKTITIETYSKSGEKHVFIISIETGQ